MTELFFAEEPVIVNGSITPDNPRVGKSIVIQCIFDGIPIPQSTDVVWGKDGDELSEIDNKNIKIVYISTLPSSILEISQATTMDSGMYECNISNIAGFASHSFRINVLGGQLQFTPIPRHIITAGLFLVCLLCG